MATVGFESPLCCGWHPYCHIMTDKTMSETCEVDGCENRAHTFIEKGDDSIEGMLYCEQHFREIFFGETDE